MRKQQTKTSKKIQQQKELDRRQKEEDQKKQEEEEERRKREEEIRKIRDLSNQEEQYNRFMKLVGGKRRSRSRVTNFLHGVLTLHLGFMNDSCLAPSGFVSPSYLNPHVLLPAFPTPRIMKIQQ